MAGNKQGNGCVSIAVVLGVVFMLGRCSASDPAPPTSPIATEVSEEPRRALVGSEGEPDADPNLIPIDDPFVGVKAEAEPESPPEPVEREVYFRNCAAARAAGAAPVSVGEPGYARRLDRDGDGVGCE